MSSAISAVHEDLGQSVDSRTKFSDSDLFIIAGFVQLLQKTSVSVRMRSTSFEGL